MWGCPLGEMVDLEKLSQMCKEKNRWTFFVTSAPANVPSKTTLPYRFAMLLIRSLQVALPPTSMRPRYSRILASKNVMTYCTQLSYVNTALLLSILDHRDVVDVTNLPVDRLCQQYHVNQQTRCLLGRSVSLQPFRSCTYVSTDKYTTQFK